MKKATMSASMAMPKLRQPARSRPRHMRATMESCVVIGGLQRDAGGVEDFAEDRFGLLGFLLRRDVTRADDNAVREDGNDEPLEIVRQTKIAAFEKRARLSRAMQHHGTARADAEAQLFGGTRALDNLQRVIEQAFLDLHLRGGFLH